MLYDKIYSKYYKSDIDFNFVSGDIGAFPYTPHSYYHNTENFNFYASGIGNNKHYKAVLVEIGDNTRINFLDLRSNTIERKQNIQNSMFRYINFKTFFFRE